MAANPRPRRVALVVHPTRPIASAIETLQRWAARQGLDVVQIPAFGGTDREVARQGEIEPGDLVVALGGDGKRSIPSISIRIASRNSSFTLPPRTTLPQKLPPT